MIAYSSTVPLESKTQAGVTVIIKKPSAARRADLTLRLSGLMGEMEDLARQAPEDGTEVTSPADVAKQNLLITKYNGLLARISSVRVEAFVDSIKGLTIDGKPATAESLVAAGPEDLLGEVAVEVMRLLGLTGEEQKNSPRPTTSSPEGGPDPSTTTADSAE